MAQGASGSGVGPEAGTRDKRRCSTLPGNPEKRHLVTLTPRTWRPVPPDAPGKGLYRVSLGTAEGRDLLLFLFSFLKGKLIMIQEKGAKPHLCSAEFLWQNLSSSAW